MKKLLTREQAGMLVREVWLVWAAKQPDVHEHPSWLTSWEDLPERDREVDEIAEAGRLVQGPAGQPECVWVGRRVVALLWRDDLDTAIRHLELYDRFGCPGAHIQATFRCLIRQGALDPKAQDTLIAESLAVLKAGARGLCKLKGHRAEVADAFVASRLGGEHGATFGTLDAGLATASARRIVDRAWAA